ncbi:MAG: alkaline phosphatase [Thermodesulfobacteriota bacterium]|nr:alkaline phosphatase [Thermodesulfobacteriota bacterium]
MKKKLFTKNCLSHHVMLTLFVAFALIISSSAFASSMKLYNGKPAKYVFFFIGDGMGIPQRTAAENYMEKRLLVDTFPAQGITTTHAADRFITGSAASATALGCGQKTNIGVIGMTPNHQSVKSVAHLAKGKGMKVGIISSVSIDHATPAAFYAHVPKRSQYYDIAVQLSESGFDFFGGGGLKDTTDKKKKSSNYRGDALGLIKKAGYKIVTNKADFMALKKRDGKVLAWNAWLQDGKAMPYKMDMTEKDITLAQFTSKAIEMLDNSKGFFLMVEGGKIDWACHANDATASIINTIAFDEAVKVAVNFARKKPNDTLIVVTGDHECGGLTLGFAGTKYATNFDILSHQKISFQKFTDEIFKKFKAKGNSTFNDIKPLITRYFGLRFKGDTKDGLVLQDYQVKMLEDAFVQSMAGKRVRSKDPITALLYGGYEPLTVTITHVLNNKAGLAWTSYKHTGVPVTTSAKGLGEEIFNGYYDNTDVAKKIMTVMGIAPKVYFSFKEDTMKLAANH